ncbi:uncharacterized protein LOC127010821 [Drosophila biarmipes]|uniref:uncharacterized protein LOC127010821 n=1 Tax=Drosophila biarmipes TaxID=125945 RepID=UPI0021CCC266|nr:uncharacterized protein LOC127010821 [Drosophila biarmipes]
MRSLFSNRYNNKRRDFYERYEAARALHPSLPPYERPVEPAELQVFNPNSSRRRYLSYRQVARLTREQLDNDTWLSSSRLPIVVRRAIEGRHHKLLMPRYNPDKATHEFSHNGRARRGRPPTAATVARLASDFAVQVGGLRPAAPAGDDSSSPSEGEDEEEETEVEESSKESEDADSEGLKPKARPQKSSTKKSKNQSQSTDLNANQDINQGVSQSTSQNITQIDGQNMKQVDSQITDQHPSHNVGQNLDQNCKPSSPHVQLRSQSQAVCRYSDEDEDYNPLDMGPIEPSLRSFICQSCKQNFALRRSLYKHQREAGHHTWSHRCAQCGQVFRTAGFKRMHSARACERNLAKLRASQASEVKQLGRRTMPE